MAALYPQGGRATGFIGTGRGPEQGGLPPSSVLSMTPASGTRTCTIQPWPMPSVTGLSTTPIPSRLRANPCASARASPSDSPHGGQLHHARGRHAPFPRNGCTIPAVASTIICGQAALFGRCMQAFSSARTIVLNNIWKSRIYSLCFLFNLSF